MNEAVQLCDVPT